jgi:hypothetical protein
VADVMLMPWLLVALRERLAREWGECAWTARDAFDSEVR